MSHHVVLPGGVVRTGGTLVDVLVTVHLFQVAREVVARDVLLAERTLKVKEVSVASYWYFHIYEFQLLPVFLLLNL